MMSREIKFRAWDVATQEMITKGYDYQLRLIRSDVGEDGYDGAIHQQTTKESDQYHLMQYTGLKDKNGVEIYEGDFIKYRNDVGNTATNLDRVVTFEGGSFGIRNPRNYEVIGNIYENRELLKEEK